MDNTPTILVAEDCGATFGLLETIFKRSGIRVLRATTADEATLLSFEMRPDLVLMDVKLARGSGLDSVRRLRALPDTANIPIIAFTGSMTAMQLREEALAAGCQDCLTKPFRMADLAWLIQKWMGSGTGAAGKCVAGNV